MSVILAKLHDMLERWEAGVDLAVRSPWFSLAVWLYGLSWITVERGNIGWDGWATLAALEIASSIRRWQNRNDQRLTGDEGPAK